MNWVSNQGLSHGVSIVNVEGASGSIIICREVVDSDHDPRPSRRLQKKDDQDFHAIRERAEREAAEQAASQQCRQLHQELAEAHSKIAGCPGWPRGH